jgi:hypothetical protein
MPRSISRRPARVDQTTATEFIVTVPTTIEGINVKTTIENLIAENRRLTARIVELERKTAALP